MQTQQLHTFLIVIFFLSILSCGKEKNTSTSDNTNLTGAQLYASNCESCHGSLNSSQKKGSSADMIANAIATVSDMSSLQGKLSDQQINKIADALQ
jgi:mono/diheme cytochrome c family protein